MSRRVRILHVLHTFSAGGLENGIVNIINRSPDHLIHELCFLSRGGEFLRRINRPIIFHELNKKCGNDVRLILRLRQLFKTRRVDVVHTRNWGAFDAFFAACLTAKPVLVHGEHGRDISDIEGLIYRRNFARRLFSFRAKKYVAVSRDLYRWLKDTVNIPERKLVLIPNGVDTTRFYPGRESAMRAELGIADNEFVVGTIGRLDPIKNYEGVIDAVRSVNREGHKIRLIICGDGPNKTRIEDRLRSSPIVPEPLLLGYRPDVDRLYRMFDVFVLNSFGEGMSNTLLEAMASRLPIVCTAVGGNVELISNRQTGIVIKAGD